MTEAHKENLVECIVASEKGIHATDDDGNRTHFKIGEKVKLAPGTAARFIRTGYCTSPKVAAAKEAVAREEEEAMKAAAAVKPRTTNQIDPNAPAGAKANPATPASGGG
jgi:transketolase C-terminal domain/subunit